MNKKKIYRVIGYLLFSIGAINLWNNVNYALIIWANNGSISHNLLMIIVGCLFMYSGVKLINYKKAGKNT
jgi:hypothetical protein